MRIDWYVPPTSGGWAGRIQVNTSANGRKKAFLHQASGRVAPLTNVYIDQNIKSGWWVWDETATLLAVGPGL